MNQDILDAVDPPAQQLKLFYQDNAYADTSVVTMQKTYAATGEAESITLTNNSSEDVSLVSVSVSDPDHFSVSGLSSLPSTIASGKSATYTVTYKSTADGINSATMTIAYTVSGKTRSFAVTLKATRTTDVSNVSVIAVYDDSNAEITSNSSTAYDFGYSSSPIDIVFTIKNNGAQSLSITDAISSNSSDFSILTSPVGTVASGASTVIKVRRLDGRVGSSATISLVSNASNTAIFKLNVSSKNFESGSVSVLNGASTISLGSSFDMGYSAGSVINKTFTIKNTGVGYLMVYSVTSSNSSGISVSSKPATNSTIAEGGSADFVLTLPAGSVATSATITVTTSDSAMTAFTINVSGGGATSSLSHSGAITYKLKAYGYDFGYAPGATTKPLTLTNSGAFPVTLTGNLMSSSSFVVASMPSAIAAGSTGTLSVTYTPTSASAWNDGTCTLYDSAGRTYQIYFCGSGFHQPSDISSVPALWLRADRIGSSDLISVDSASKVSTWQDVSGHGLVANAETYNGNKLRPAYNSGNASMNGFPSITFSGTGYTDELSVTSTGGFVNTSSGTTTFVAFRTGNSVDGNRYLLQSFYTNNTLEVFPRLMWEGKYIDTGDGLYASSLPTVMTPAIPAGSGSNPLIVYMLGTYGNTNSASRYFCDSDWTSPSLVTAKTYVAALKYVSTNATAKATPNMWAWLNNYPDNASTLKNKTLGYLYSSYNTTTVLAAGANTNYPSANTYYFGAYGKPVSTGDGMINSTVAANDFATYIQGIVATPSYSSTPGTTTNHAYFYNWLDQTYNTHIRTLYIGATNSWTNNFMGDIAEIIMYDVPLSAADIATVSSYLMTKYGVTTRMTP